MTGCVVCSGGDPLVGLSELRALGLEEIAAGRHALEPKRAVGGRRRPSLQFHDGDARIGDGPTRADRRPCLRSPPAEPAGPRRERQEREGTGGEECRRHPEDRSRLHRVSPGSGNAGSFRRAPFKAAQRAATGDGRKPATQSRDERIRRRTGVRGWDRRDGRPPPRRCGTAWDDELMRLGRGGVVRALRRRGEAVQVAGEARMLVPADDRVPVGGLLVWAVVRENVLAGAPPAAAMRARSAWLWRSPAAARTAASRRTAPDMRRKRLSPAMGGQFTRCS